MIFLIIGVVGAIGSAKSFTQLKHGLQYCEDRNKQLVVNFPINIDALYRYAISPKILDKPFGAMRLEFQKLFKIIAYNLKLCIHAIGWIGKPKLKLSVKPRLPWVAKLCKDGGIIQIFNADKLEALMIPESVVLLDEAGILLNSREFATTSKKLLADLAQSRKDGVDLIWCAQFDDQVDRQMRMLTQFWIHCQSLSAYDKKLRRPKLFLKQIFWFRCSDYQRWLADPSARGNYFKTRFAYSIQSEEGALSEADKLIFSIYDSFARLDSQSGYYQTESFSLINSIFQCKFPRDYYFERLENYRSEDDPFSPSYQPFYGYFSKPKVVSSPSLFQPEFVHSDKSSLIRKALALARSRNLRNLPTFRDMELRSIESWILANSNGRG